MAAKRESKADFLRRWLLPYPAFQYQNLRYKHPPEKGVYWYYFSLDVRNRDVKEWGTCISCGRAITVETCDAGHFMPAHGCGRDLLFDPLNVNAECRRCNGFDETHLLGYSEGLDARYGERTAAGLRYRMKEYKEGPPVKDYSKEHYAQLIRQTLTYQQTLTHASEEGVVR